MSNHNSQFKTMSPVILQRIESLIEKGRQKGALAVLKHYRRDDIQSWYSNHANKWIEEKKYALLHVFFNTKIELNPSLPTLLEKAFKLKDEDLACFSAKQGVFECDISNDPIRFFELQTSFLILNELPARESDKLIEAMFSDKNKTKEELEFVFESWAKIVEISIKLNYIQSREITDKFDEKVQILYLKTKLEETFPLSHSIPLSKPLKRI